ncbi:MAG: universal stress protein [Nocardioides sp.]
MKTLVCGVDNSPTAAAAAGKAAELAVALGAHLHLVSAYGKVETETVEIRSETLVLSTDMEAERVAGAIAVDLRRRFPDLEVLPEAAEGRPGEALVSAARRLDADLIVVGNKRVQGIARVLGSVARDVVGHAPCDVYVAHTHHRA